MLRALIPSRLRQAARRTFDRCFHRQGLGLVKLGKICTWTVLESRLKAGAMVISGGAGNDISFEVELAEKYSCRVAVFDPSPTGQKTFDALAERKANLTFHPIGLSAETCMVRFAEPINAAEGSFKIPVSSANIVSYPCVSPRDALSSAGLNDIELLKIDIEGFEYDFLGKMIEQGIRPSQIAVEFHHFMPKVSLRRTLRTLWRLRRAGYVIAHKEQCDFLLLHKSVIHS